MVKITWPELVDKNYGGVRFHHTFQGYPIYHSHDFFEVIICTSGKMIQNINDDKFSFNKYDSSFITPYDAHSIIYEDNDTSHYAIEINADYFHNFCDGICLDLYSKIIERKYRTFSISENRLRKIISYLNQIRDSGDDPQGLTVAVNMFLFNVIEPIINTTKLIYENNHSKWINELLIEINKPENLSWSVSDIVANYNYCHTHLSRLFKEEMNMSLLQYLTTVKMNNARDLLLYSTLSLEEIREALGYLSLSHFNNLFKKYYKMTPGKYRIMHQNKDNTNNE